MKRFTTQSYSLFSTWQIDQSQRNQGDGRQRLVHHHQWELVEIVLSWIEVGQQYIPDKVVTVEEEEEQGGD